ncbi:MAG: NUDIX hydrolase [Defluviitaleaceae bacterium]|nr:NUDIX hydrolase [Defluviitaleaceae bacterium]MCL2262747.1 NUDIX hydrolase [Defluviitaleaceae bacterium]
MDRNIVSCGGVVIYKNRVLVLYKNQNGRHLGWVMPKGNIEQDETHKQTALREVKEESGVSARILKYLGKTQYSFKGNPEQELISKTVHWYLMTTNSFYCKPQAEEFFADAGFYKQHEAYHLLKFHDERQIMRRAFTEYSTEVKRLKIKNTERTKTKWTTGD